MMKCYQVSTLSDVRGDKDGVCLLDPSSLSCIPSIASTSSIALNTDHEFLFSETMRDRTTLSSANTHATSQTESNASPLNWTHIIFFSPLFLSFQFRRMSNDEFVTVSSAANVNGLFTMLEGWDESVSVFPFPSHDE